MTDINAEINALKNCVTHLTEVQDELNALDEVTRKRAVRYLQDRFSDGQYGVVGLLEAIVGEASERGWRAEQERDAAVKRAEAAEAKVARVQAYAAGLTKGNSVDRCRSAEILAVLDDTVTEVSGEFATKNGDGE